MEQIATEQVMKGLRSQVRNEVTVGNQTYMSPLTERVLIAFNSLRPYIADEVDASSDWSGYDICRERLFSADLYDFKAGGERRFTNRSGLLFQEARKLYLKALERNLNKICAKFDSGERARLVTPMEITVLCQQTMTDAVLGEPATVVFDSRLAYAEPNNADQIDRVERRYHGVKRYSDNE